MSTPPKILIIRLSSMGDIVLTTPVIRCLHQQLGAQIDVLVKPQFRELLLHNPNIHAVQVLDALPALKAAALKGEAYDFVIDLHNNLRTAQIKSVLSVPAFSFPKINLEKWLKVQFGVDLLPAQHVVDRYFEAVAPLGVFNDGKGLDFFIATRDGALAIEGFNPETAFITWCIGGQHFTKRFPEKQVAALCRNLSVQVLLIGGPEDAVRAQQIVTAAGKHVFNACGLLNIHQSAYAISKSKLLLSNDTGMMHIGAALRKPIISFWGNTIPEFGMSPYYGGHPVQQRVLEIKDLYCRPCSKIGFDQCPEKHFRCMKDVNTDRVLRAVSEMLAREVSEV